MSTYADRLLKHIEENPGFIEPEARAKEMINNFIKPGLQDLCVTRSSFTWGVPVPGDEKHVIYVWIDALSNYITAMGYSVDEKGELYNKYWPCDVHVIGKDIVRFHTIYWPILLMALGEPLPKKIYGHGWMNFGVDKMSKSRGNVMYADDLVNYFGVDGVRYYALSEMPYSADGSITYDAIIGKYNTDLANNLGNLVSRTIAMCKKYFGGIVPVAGEEGEFDASLKAAVADAILGVDKGMESYHVADAIDSVFDMLRRANKYIDETTPWVLAKTEEGTERLKTVIYNLLETIRVGACLLLPFIPETAEKILSALATDNRELSFGGLAAGLTLGELAPLFARIDEAKMMERINADREKMFPTVAVEEKKEEKAEETEREYEALAPQITFDDFLKPDLRVAKVLECEVVPKSKKLLKLQLDLGFEKRQVLSGISKFYKPEDLIGKKVIMVANLAPRMMGGIESNGMVLATGEEDVKVLFAADDAQIGDRVG